VSAPRSALLAAALLALAGPLFAREPLKVVATLPDLADLTQSIGGERVTVTTLCKGSENPHFVTAKPSHLVALSRAELFVQVGLSLESAFVPGLLEQCRNPRIQPGAPGFVSAGQGWTALDVPAQLDRREGDIHPEGNPHVNLAPGGGRHLAARILAGLCRVDPASKPDYEQRHAALLLRLDEAEARWKALAAGWKGRTLVVYHKEYDYLAAASGLTILGSIEPKPGIAPTPGHIAQLVAQVRAHPGTVLVSAVWSFDKHARELAAQTGAPLVELPNMVKGLPGTDTWIAMMDFVHQRLDAALRSAAPAPKAPPSPAGG